MKIVLHVTDVQIKGKVEVGKQQHLYHATNTMQAISIIIQLMFILWYDAYYPAFVENFLSYY